MLNKTVIIYVLFHDFGASQCPGQVGSNRVEDRLFESTCNGTLNSAKPSCRADFAHCSNALRACSSTVSAE